MIQSANPVILSHKDFGFYDSACIINTLVQSTIFVYKWNKNFGNVWKRDT